MHDAAGRFVSEFKQDVENAFNDLNRNGGFFQKLGEGISDAVGAGFNISGKSPLILVLIPAIGAIAAAIAGVVQIVNALAAVLTTIPALVAAIGLQAGALMLAFHGVGTAIQGAFAAKNWNDFYAAIQGLTPAAQNFIISLLPLRDLFRELQKTAQEGFFTGFGNAMVNVVNALGPILRSGIPAIATALGGLFNQIALFFASPVFVKFVNDIIPATLRWLQKFGPDFTDFLTALIGMADTAIPFLERVGQIVSNAFGTFTDWLNDQVKNGNLTDWLDRMGDTLDHVSELFFNAAKFVSSFLDALDKGGGNDILDQFSDLFSRLADFFGSEAGQAAMDGFIHAVEALTYAFSGLVFVLLGLFIGFEAILQFLGFIGFEFMKFVGWVTDTAAPAIGKFFTETLPGFFSDLWQKVKDVWGKITEFISEAFGNVVDWVKNKWNEFTDWISGKVNSVVDFFKGIPDDLANIGRKIMQGLKDGLQWGWDHTVGPILHWITSQIPSWKGPEEKDRKLLEPAGQAVMEGFGKGLSQGADQLRTMLGDFTNSIGDVGYRGAEVGGMPINVNVDFHGAVPTEQQAYDTGRAAGRGIADEMTTQINQRGIRLAVRMAG